MSKLSLSGVAIALLAALVFHLALVQPNHPLAMTWRALLLFPLELPAILLGLMAFGNGRTGQLIRAVFVACLTLIIVLKSADFVMFTALSKGFNPVTDLPLVVSLFQLLAGTFGTIVSLLAVMAVIVLIILVVWVLWWASGVWAAIKLDGLWRTLPPAGAVVFAGLATAEIGQAMGRWSLPIKPPGAAFTARVGVERIKMVRETTADLRRFRSAAKSDIYAEQTGLLDQLDRNVLVIFVESYGRTSFDTPLFVDLHLETLRKAQADLEGRGLSIASTFMTSPTRGGQSWLAHATFANGLWIDNQTSYRAALSSNRKTIFHIAQDAGFETAAVMPQITLAWPEAQYMGFDTILAAADLGYEGLPFNWIQMPDQFTLGAMDRLLLDAASAPSKQFIQVALGSSHAPWVPVPDLIGWDEMGDGTVFNPIVAASDTPEVVWRDHDRVRAQYRLAIDYALQTVFSYAALHAEDAPLILVIGDHQASGFVALDERSDVPMHVIGPQHLVDLIADSDFYDGLIPPTNTRVRSMDEMRDHLIAALSAHGSAEVKP